MVNINDDRQGTASGKKNRDDRRRLGNKNLIDLVFYWYLRRPSSGKSMIALLSMTSLVAGVGVACAADYAPARVAALESWGGGLLVAGLALLGVALGAAAPIVH
jgi:hypothetical protein